MIKIKHNGAKGAKSTQFKTKQLLINKGGRSE